MKDIKELFEDACSKWVTIDPEIIFKEENGGVQIIKGEDKMLFKGGTRDQLYTAVLRALVRNSFSALCKSEELDRPDIGIN